MLPLTLLPNLSPNAAKLYLVLQSLAAQFPSKPAITTPASRLATLCNFSRRSTSLALRQLIDLHLLSRTPPGYHTPASYRLQFPAAQAHPRAPLPPQAQPAAPVPLPAPAPTPLHAPKNPQAHHSAKSNTPPHAHPAAPQANLQQDLHLLASFTAALFDPKFQKLTPAAQSALLAHAEAHLDKLDATYSPPPKSLQPPTS